MAVLVLASAAAGYSFYKLGNVGLGNPQKAQVWFGLLLISLVIAAASYLVFAYNRSKLSRSSGDEIAIQALAAAGRNAAKTRAEQAAPVTKPTGKAK